MHSFMQSDPSLSFLYLCSNLASLGCSKRLRLMERRLRTKPAEKKWKNGSRQSVSCISLCELLQGADCGVFMHHACHVLRTQATAHQDKKLSLARPSDNFAPLIIHHSCLLYRQEARKAFPWSLRVTLVPFDSSTHHHHVGYMQGSVRVRRYGFGHYPADASSEVAPRLKDES